VICSFSYSFKLPGIAVAEIKGTGDVAIRCDAQHSFLAPVLSQARVKLDGRELDYAKRLQHSSSSNSCERDFEGFAYTEPSSGYVYYKAFKFAALQPTAGAATVEHPDQIQAGRIEVTCVAVVQHSDSHRSYHHGDRKWCTDAADKKLPEGALPQPTCFAACCNQRYEEH
jgi:hypothetical protein